MDRLERIAKVFKNRLLIWSTSSLPAHHCWLKSGFSTLSSFDNYAPSDLAIRTPVDWCWKWSGAMYYLGRCCSQNVACKLSWNWLRGLYVIGIYSSVAKSLLDNSRDICFKPSRCNWRPIRRRRSAVLNHCVVHWYAMWWCRCHRLQCSTKDIRCSSQHLHVTDPDIPGKPRSIQVGGIVSPCACKYALNLHFCQDVILIDRCKSSRPQTFAILCFCHLLMGSNSPSPVAGR